MENNKIIAEFIGAIYRSDKSNYQWFPTKEKMTMYDFHPEIDVEKKGIYGVQQMKYDTSWDWVMNAFLNIRSKVWDTLTYYPDDFMEILDLFKHQCFNVNIDTCNKINIDMINWYNNFMIDKQVKRYKALYPDMGTGTMTYESLNDAIRNGERSICILEFTVLKQFPETTTVKIVHITNQPT